MGGPTAESLRRPWILNDRRAKMDAFVRPNQTVDIGAVDAGCAIVVCDANQAIIHVTPAWEELTGYNSDEVKGQNCRFLQSSDGQPHLPGKRSKLVDKDKCRQMRDAIRDDKDVQLRIVNFKKGGKRFVNLLTIVRAPSWGYSVGFLGVQGQDE